MQPSVDIDFIYEDDRWKSTAFDPEQTAAQAINALFALTPYDGDDHTTLSIVLAEDTFVQDLNKNYRGKDKPTNILSFPMDEDDMLGDLVLSYDTIVAESDDQKKTFENHYTHLIIHGVLHLLGYDHIDDAEADEMEQQEIDVLSRLKIANPYI